jgi:predicted small integral membrane protein
MKIVIVLALVAVLGALGGAGLFMLRRRPGDEQDRQAADARMARALAVRVGLSISVFLLVLLAWWMGWIQPTGLPAGR